jgi:ribA/ribD-fused uncharacterized protein
MVNPEQLVNADYVVYCEPDGPNGFLSNQLVHPFTTYDGFTYNSSEQLIMAEKGRLFCHDRDNSGHNLSIVCKIMQTDDGETQKKLGREIKGFSSQVWNLNKFRIMIDALKNKFSDQDLRGQLLATEDKRIIYANPCDRIWGAGVSYDQLVTSYPRWTDSFFDKVSSGTESVDDWVQLAPNLLGKALENVRASLRDEPDVWNLVEEEAKWQAEERT